MSQSKHLSRRDFLNRSLAAAGAAGAATGISAEPLARTAQAGSKTANQPPSGGADPIPCGRIGNVKISRLLLGGNLISGCMHARDLKYVSPLFRAYADEDKILQTLKVAEEHGINTVFESGANFIERYNRECGGHMQFIPHIQVSAGQSEKSLKEHIQKQVDSGAVALYVWGVAADRLVQAGAIHSLGKAVELAKKHDLPVGVGGHSLLVPKACETHHVPCDFYVKTLHSDNYPSATPKALRKEFIWLDGGEGWYDNMWCINPEETIAFMKTVTKPWLAFKVLAAGAFYPRDGFRYAFEGGADFIAVGMFDFQIAQNCEQVRKEIRRAQHRERPWRAL